MIGSIIAICISNPDLAVSFMLDGTSEAVRLTLKLIAIYSLWSGLLQIMTDSGIDNSIAKMFKPITKRIFKGENDETQGFIAMNLTANFLGMGGAATSMGIRSMELMGQNKKQINKNMMLFFIINVSSVQLLPTTVIALRSSMSSNSPSDIILPSFIVSAFTTCIGILSVLIIERIKSSIPIKKIKRTVCITTQH